MSNNLHELLQRTDIWRASQQLADDNPAIPTGFAALDAHLPGGGWSNGALTEILLPHEGIGELRLFMPALARLSHEGCWLAWVAPPYIPYAPALAACGINLSRVLLIHPKARNDGLWAVEQALRSGTCGAVLAWPTAGDFPTQRRLQLAAEAGNAVGILFRAESTATPTSYATIRLRLEAAPGGIIVHVLKRRGGRPAGPLFLNLDKEGFM